MAKKINQYLHIAGTQTLHGIVHGRGRLHRVIVGRISAGEGLVIRDSTNASTGPVIVDTTHSASDVLGSIEVGADFSNGLSGVFTGGSGKITIVFSVEDSQSEIESE